MKDSIKQHIAKVPSDIRLSLIDMVGLCPVCDIYEGHKIVPCTGCDKDLCMSHIEGIYSIGPPHLKRFVCVKCRHHIATTTVGRVSFYYTKTTKI